jgi:hypothetical protein
MYAYNFTREVLHFEMTLHVRFILGGSMRGIDSPNEEGS